MLGRLRLVLVVAIAAVLGAVAGRIAAEARRRDESGERPGGFDLASITVRPQDLVPGFVAAVRVRDRPWSWLHIPSWLAAFGVNFGVAAVGGDLSRLREMAEHAAFGMAGIEIPGMDLPHRRGADDADSANGAARGFDATSGGAANGAGSASSGSSWPGSPPSPSGQAPTTGFTPFRD